MNKLIYRFASDIPLITQEWIAAAVCPSPEREAAASAFGRVLAEQLISAAEHPRIAEMRASVSPKLSIETDGVAVLNVKGPLAFNPDPWEMIFSGVEDTAAVTAQINQAAKMPGVRGLLLNIDSPGGMMLGGMEMSHSLRALAQQKPVVAHTSGMMASLAYMLGSQASEVVASVGAIVGSIGVIASWPDVTGWLEKMGVKMEVFTNREAIYKGIGAPGKPLTDQQRSHMQASVDGAFRDFADTVRSVRPNVPDAAMQGQVFRGKEAKAMGLVDRIGNQDFALSILRDRIRNNTQPTH